MLKETYLPNHWESGRVRDSLESDPYEVVISQALAAASSNDNVVRYIDHATYARLKMFRIYMEYCEHGTLMSMVDEYGQFARSNPVTSIGKQLPK